MAANTLEKCPNTRTFTSDSLTLTQKQDTAVMSHSAHVGLPTNRPMHHLFEAQAALNPTATAIVFASVDQAPESISYGELNKKANRLAHYLIDEKGIKADTPIGLCIERSLEMVIAMLAILKAGGAYVPLDPQYPSARLAYILKDAELTTVLTQSHLLENTPVSADQALCIDDSKLNETLRHQADTNILPHQRVIKPNHLAYIIYTSGSTGNPKGVMIEHRSLTNFLCSMHREPGISANDSLLAVSSSSFDIHTLELFLPLISGAKIILASRTACFDPEALLALLEHNSVTMMQATPATWKLLIEYDWEQKTPLKILCGGEALSPQLAGNLLKQPMIELWNMYGPTETTVWSCTHRVTAIDTAIAVGKPIANTQIYVVNEKLQLCTAGAAGELMIAGSGLSRGYLNQPQLTKKQFILNPFHDKNDPNSSEQLYKTGDLMSLQDDGSLYFIGRIDHQVKIRGFRIELGEIEHALMRQDDIKDAVVLAKEDKFGDHYLVAYVVSNTIENQDKSTLTNTIEKWCAVLGQDLPSYMIPTSFIVLDKFPLSPNGKVDRKKLLSESSSIRS